MLAAVVLSVSVYICYGSAPRLIKAVWERTEVNIFETYPENEKDLAWLPWPGAGSGQGLAIRYSGMSQAGELAARILRDLRRKRIVPVADQIRLRCLARTDEMKLPIEEIARRILARESEPPVKSKIAGQE